MKALYDSYPNDADHMPRYVAYQAKYRREPRESDKVILAMLEGLSGNLLDIGCSTGNLLFHIKQLGGFTLSGGDMSRLQIEGCKRDPALVGVEFSIMDVLRLPDREFDVITANAILYGFDEERFSQALRSIGRALRPGGRLIAFDFFHPFDQEVAIIERSASFPEGHPLHFRSYSRTERALAAAGFTSQKFTPFQIQVELPFQGYDSIGTHTKGGFQFRGCLVQPWCHLMAGHGNAL